MIYIVENVLQHTAPELAPGVHVKWDVKHYVGSSDISIDGFVIYHTGRVDVPERHLIEMGPEQLTAFTALHVKRAQREFREWCRKVVEGDGQ